MGPRALWVIENLPNRKSMFNLVGYMINHSYHYVYNHGDLPELQVG